MGRFIPRGSGPHISRGNAVWLVLLTCGLFLATAAEVFAQASESVRTFYCPQRSFDIPFTLHDNDPRLEILLNVSTDDGRSYHHSASARPPERRFRFTAPADGWYHFIVQTRDVSGALSPENLRGATPSIRICVDTKDPIIDSFTADTAGETALPTIRWKITEPNLKEVLADYRSTSDGVWMPLFLPPNLEGTHTWKPSCYGELEVRLMAVDKAERRSEVRTLRLQVSNNVARMPPPQDQAGAGKVMFVRSKTFQLDYKLDLETVGPSAVRSVDIWKLHPGEGWRKCQEKGGSTGPAIVTVERSGRWGFRIIPCSGVGLKEPDPKPGDAPDVWVEVDDKKPHVVITNVIVKQEGDDGYLTVYWKAGDEFLRSLPITIFLAPHKGGDWKAIVSDLPNSGYWRQKTKDLNLGQCYEFALKVVAIDEAGNIGESQWADTVKVDLKVPRIKSIEVKPDGNPGGQQSFGASSTSQFPGSYSDNPSAGQQSPSPFTARDQNFSNPQKK